jgi:hypothetical protein
MTGYSEVLNLRAMVFKRQYDRIFWSYFRISCHIVFWKPLLVSLKLQNILSYCLLKIIARKFKTSEYPVILSFENHCSVNLRAMVFKRQYDRMFWVVNLRTMVFKRQYDRMFWVVNLRTMVLHPVILSFENHCS